MAREMYESVKRAERLAAIRQQLKEHRALPFIHRLGERIFGPYPSYPDREELRRAELSSLGRFKEDIDRAITHTKEANGYFLSFMPRFPTASREDETIKSSVLVPPSHMGRQDFTRLRKVVESIRGDRLPETVEGVALYRPKRSNKTPDSSTVFGGFCFVYGGEEGPRDITKIYFSEDEFSKLPDDTQELLGGQATLLCNFAARAEVMRAMASPLEG